MIRTSSTPVLTASDRKTVEELAALVPSRWPVDSLVLYGSKARGDDTPESDIDLLVLTGHLLAPEEIGELRAVSRRMGLTHGTWPELSIRTSEEWWRGVYQAAPIRKEIDAEGVDIPLPLPRERR
jgi:predicted nucleotidyltransferase